MRRLLLPSLVAIMIALLTADPGLSALRIGTNGAEALTGTDGNEQLTGMGHCEGLGQRRSIASRNPSPTRTTPVARSSNRRADAPTRPWPTRLTITP